MQVFLNMIQYGGHGAGCDTNGYKMNRIYESQIYKADLRAVSGTGNRKRRR